MRKVLVTCLCRAYQLRDLQVSLHKGDELVLTEEQARQSVDLGYAHSVGAVSFRYITVCREQRSRPPGEDVPRTARLQSPPSTKRPLADPPSVMELPVVEPPRGQLQHAGIMDEKMFPEEPPLSRGRRRKREEE